MPVAEKNTEAFPKTYVDLVSLEVTTWTAIDPGSADSSKVVPVLLLLCCLC